MTINISGEVTNMLGAPALRWRSRVGTDWLGDLPEHWCQERLKHVVTSPVEKKPGRELPFVALEHIVSALGGLVPDFEWELKDASDYATFKPGDVLYGKLRPYLRKCLLADRAGCCPTELIVLRPNPDRYSAPYLYYLVVSDYFSAVADSTSYGTKMPRTSWEVLGTAAVPTPPLDEQRAIAGFLDRETAQIDALIAKKERLIELLQEKRAALISHAVTKGLDPTAPTRDSGIPWIGHIPAHWERRKLKHVVSLVTSGSRGWAEHYSDEGATFLRIGNIRRGSYELDLSDIQHVSPPKDSEGSRTRIRQDDLLVSITAYIGSIGLVTQDIGEAYVNQHVALVRPITPRIHPGWLASQLLGSGSKAQFDSLLYGGTKDGLGLDDVRNLDILVPPMPEQVAIDRFLREQEQTMECLVRKVQQHIQLLQELRTALISAAVTGKIDVRGEATA